MVWGLPPELGSPVVELARGGERTAGAADLIGIERRLDEQDQPLDTGVRERLATARVWPEPSLVEPREHRDDEARRLTARRRPRVARHAHEIGEPRMHRLRVEAVAVTGRYGGHAG